jgi:hypothetical protein
MPSQLKRGNKSLPTVDPCLDSPRVSKRRIEPAAGIPRLGWTEETDPVPYEDRRFSSCSGKTQLA